MSANPTFLPRSTVSLPGAGQTAHTGPFNFGHGAGHPVPAPPGASPPHIILNNAPFNWLTLSPLQSQSSASRV